MMKKIRKLGVRITKRVDLYEPLKQVQFSIERRLAFRRLPKKRISELNIQAFDGLHSEKRGDTLCFFSSFDIDSVVDDYVIYYLKALNEQLGADVIFVSTSASMPGSERKKLEPYCRKILHRENVGRDFGSWKAGFAKTKDWKRYHRLILANDSVYGPFTSLATILPHLESTSPTVVAITDNLEIEPHLQSYFFAINRAAMRASFFKRFWRNFIFFEHRDLTIERYELGFSRAAALANCRMIALKPYADIRDAALKESPQSYGAIHAATRGVNPTHYFWKELITRWGGPFLKVDLVRSNPISLPDVDTAPQIVAEHTTYPAELIKNHLKRVLRKK